MSKYRKKPVVIEAWIWDPADYFNVGQVVAEMRMAGIDFYVNGEQGIDIHTLEGTMTANRGDWIIKGVRGEFYPCKPDIFETIYEGVE